MSLELVFDAQEHRDADANGDIQSRILLACMRGIDVHSETIACQFVNSGTILSLPTDLVSIVIVNTLVSKDLTPFNAAAVEVKEV